MTGQAFPRVTLSTERLALRPFERGDAGDVHAVWNDEAFLRFAPARFPHAAASLPRATKWCTCDAEEQRLAGHGVNFAGAERNHGRLVCHVSLFSTDWTSMNTEIHYWTAPWARGGGYAAEAARAVGRWALTGHGFARITLKTVMDNRSSRRVAEAAGFCFEGILRNGAWTREGRGDMAMYSLIPQDLDEHRGS